MFLTMYRIIAVNIIFNIIYVSTIINCFIFVKIKLLHKYKISGIIFRSAWRLIVVKFINT